MEEKEIRESEPDREFGAGDVKIKFPISKKLENYWYHYKWHTLAALFVLIVTVVIIVQCSSRQSYDVYILYAGDKAISTSKSNPERQKFLNSFGGVTSDFDKDGEINVGFKHLYSPDEEELERLAELEKKGEGEIPYRLISQDKSSLDSLLMQSEYYLLLLDKAVFDSYSEKGRIASVLPYLPEGFDGNVVQGADGATGVYLKDTDFYKLEGICELPEDTVVCLRLLGGMATEKDWARFYESAEVFKRIVGS